MRARVPGGVVAELCVGDAAYEGDGQHGTRGSHAVPLTRVQKPESWVQHNGLSFECKVHSGSFVFPVFFEQSVSMINLN